MQKLDIDLEQMKRPFVDLPVKKTQATQAAEGVPRYRFSVRDIEAMVEAGILFDDQRLELIGGELVPMAPKSSKHEVLKQSLWPYWHKRLPEHLYCAIATTLRLSPDTYLEPDILFFHRATGFEGLNGETAQLAIEIADESLAYDTGFKAGLFACFGVQELWVMNAVSLETRIHRDPSLDGYRQIADFPKSEMLRPLFAPELEVRLTDIGLPLLGRSMDVPADRRQSPTRNEDIMKETTMTDWAEFDAMSEEERHAAALSDPDAQPLTEEDMDRMKPTPRVKIIRRALRLSQEEFAQRYHIPLETLRDWEQGRSEPDAPGRAYLKVIATNPDFVLTALAG